MTAKFALVASAFLALASVANAADGASTDMDSVSLWQADRSIIFAAEDVALDDLRWIARPLIVFADTEADPSFKEQLEFLTDRIDELAERDVMIIVDTSRDDPSDIRRKLRPRGFQITLIGKDGGVKLRKPFPWDVRELSRAIDKMPMRQQEIRDRRAEEG